MPEILIQSKITTPQLHEKIVHRGRLTTLLNDNKNKNLIVVCAPAGFGKTTLVLDYLTHQNNKFAWFSIPHKGVEDPSTFFEYIIGAIRKLNDKLGNTTVDVMKMYTQNPKMSKELVYACTASLVNEFSEYFKDDIVLVIEDLHYIDTEKSLTWLKEFFKELLDNIPSNLHLILSTRVLPEITLTNLKAKRNAFIIGENELSFNEKETAELLVEVYKYKYDVKDIKLLDKNIRGWITGLHLLLQAYGEDFNKVKYSSQIDLESIFDFFAQEIFDNLSSELQEFMMVTSLMENFDEELSNAVLGIENSRQLTDELIHKNLFIHETYSYTKDKDERRISFGYHALFRDFLNRRLQSSRIAQVIKNLMEKIGDSYVISGDEISAVNHFLEAESFYKAVPLIEKNFRTLYNSGKYDMLWDWLRLIPVSVLNVNPCLFYLLGFFHCYVNMNYELALLYIDKAEKYFQLNNSEDNLIKCICVKSTIFMYTGRIKELKLILESFLKCKLKPENEVEISRLLFNTFSELAEYDNAINIYEGAIVTCNKFKLKKLIPRIYGALGSTYNHLENYERALFYYKKGLEDEDNLYNIIMTNSDIALTYMNLENYSSAIEFSDTACRLLGHSYSEQLFIATSMHRALIMLYIGNFEESIKILEKAYINTEKSKAIIYLWHITDYLLMSNIMSKDYENSIKYLKLNRYYTEKLNIELYKKNLQIREAIFLLQFELSTEVEDMLLDDYAYFKSVNRSLELLVIKKLSDYYLRINKPELTLRYQKLFLNDVGYKANDLVDCRSIIDFALSNPELTQYKYKVHAAFEEFFDRLNIEGTSDEYKRKMKIEIDKLHDIKMTSFGAFEFVSRGVPVPGSKWRKKKGKSILAYMMVNPKAKYSKDRIIDLFFHDSKIETIDDNYKQAIFNIRNVFKNPHLSFIIAEGKTLYLNPDCYFKSDAEEFNKYCSIARSAERSCEEKIKACKEAMELYNGEYLEGNYEPWCEDLRGDFHNKFISISEFLLDFLAQEGNYEEIIQYSEKMLRHDKLNEKAYLSLIKAFAGSERLKSAKQIYSKMMKTYDEELGEKPDQKMLTKISSILENYS